MYQKNFESLQNFYLYKKILFFINRSHKLKKESREILKSYFQEMTHWVMIALISLLIMLLTGVPIKLSV